MPRPSRNLDRALLAAGRVLLPSAGARASRSAQVADAAGVNIGMFHYHFKTREAFLRAVMQADLRGDVRAAHARDRAARRLRPPSSCCAPRCACSGASRATTARFIARVLADALSGRGGARATSCATTCRATSRCSLRLIAEGQARGEIRAMPHAAGARRSAPVRSRMPILVGGAIVDSGAMPRGSRARAGRRAALRRRDRRAHRPGARGPVRSRGAPRREARPRARRKASHEAIPAPRSPPRSRRAAAGRDPGTLQGYAEGEYVRVAAPFAGTLVQLDVARGAQVQAGAPLFALEAENETAARKRSRGSPAPRARPSSTTCARACGRPELEALRAQLGQAAGRARASPRRNTSAPRISWPRTSSASRRSTRRERAATATACAWPS